MRLYSLADAASVTHGGIAYQAADDGGFDFPPDLEEHMHRLAVGGRRQWETSIERQNRMIAAEEARMRDPATLASLVADLLKAQSPPARSKPAPPAK